MGSVALVLRRIPASSNWSLISSARFQSLFVRAAARSATSASIVSTETAIFWSWLVARFSK